MTRTRFLPAAIALLALIGLQGAYGQDCLANWKEFTAAVKNGKMAADMVRPYEGISKDVLLKQLADFKGYHNKYNSWKVWENPEVFPVGD